MDTKMSSVIALISLISVIIVILYLIAGIIIRYKYPNSDANKFFGGASPDEDIVTNLLYFCALNIRERNARVSEYLSNNFSWVIARSLLRAIVQLANNVGDFRAYVKYIVGKATDLKILNSRWKITQDLYSAIDNSRHGKIEIPKDVQDRIMNPNAVLTRDQSIVDGAQSLS